MREEAAAPPPGAASGDAAAELAQPLPAPLIAGRIDRRDSTRRRMKLRGRIEPVQNDERSHGR